MRRIERVAILAKVRALPIVGLVFLASFASPAAPADKTVTLLFTNDVESDYDPSPAFWLDDLTMIGGIAEMTTLIRELRESEPDIFLFDSGDIFTGALAKLTEGRLAFELMITMGYDAMAIGNHEFEYGTEIFAWQKNRAPFPVLGANFFYKKRLVSASVARKGRAIEPTDHITVAVSGFLAEGGDLYDAFSEGRTIRELGKVSDVVIQYFQDHDVVAVPPRGRQKEVSENR